MSPLIAIFLVTVTAVVGEDLRMPCRGEGCTNVTVYLGPRWGVRVISVPKTRNTTGQSSGSGDTNDIKDPPGTSVNTEDRKFPVPQHRPIPPNDQARINFSDDPDSEDGRRRERPSPLRSIPINSSDGKLRVDVDLYGQGTLNISNRDYSGNDFKSVLWSLVEGDRKLVNKLVAEHNRIEDLPNMVFPVEFEYSLQELSLSGNQFNAPQLTSSFSFELSRLMLLKELNLSRCAIKDVEDRLNLPYLEVLDLSHNALMYLPAGIEGLTNLQHLFLQGNSITYVSAASLSSLGRLWVLDLRSNGLKDFWGDPFERLYRLVTVRLANNSLREVPELHPSRTRLVSLSGNPLDCTCQLVRTMHDPNIEVVDKDLVTCYDHETGGGPRQVQYLHEDDVHIRCLGESTGLERVWKSLGAWHRNHSDVLVNMLKVLGIVLMVGVVALLFRRTSVVGRLRTREVPYTVLDGKIAR